MSKIVILVVDGMVSQVFGSELVEVEVIDLDGFDGDNEISEKNSKRADEAIQDFQEIDFNV